MNSVDCEKGQYTSYSEFEQPGIGYLDSFNKNYYLKFDKDQTIIGTIYSFDYTY